MANLLQVVSVIAIIEQNSKFLIVQRQKKR